MYLIAALKHLVYCAEFNYDITQIAARSHDGKEWQCFVMPDSAAVDCMVQEKTGITYRPRQTIYKEQAYEQLLCQQAIREFISFLSRQEEKVFLVCHPENHGYALMDAVKRYGFVNEFSRYVSCFVDAVGVFQSFGVKGNTLESLYELTVGRLQFSLQESRGRAAALYEIFQTRNARVDPENEAYAFSVDCALLQISWRPLVAKNVVDKAEATQAAKMGKSPNALAQVIRQGGQTDPPISETDFPNFRRYLQTSGRF